MTAREQDLLVVDIGNTRTKYFLRRLLADGSSIALNQMQSHPTADIEQECRKILPPFSRSIPIVIASVVPEATRRLKEQCKPYQREVLEITNQTPGTLRNVHPELGVDLLAATTAAYSIYRDSAVIVIGLGTASTICAVTCTGRFKVVNFAPGLSLMIESLAKGCALLSQENPSAIFVPHLGGTSTADALCGGSSTLLLGGIKEWINLAKGIVGHSALVIATGGWSELVAKHVSTIDRADADLTAKGICILARSLF